MAVYRELRGQLVGSRSPYGSRDQTQVVRPGGRCIYPQSQFPGGPLNSSERIPSVVIIRQKNIQRGWRHHQLFNCHDMIQRIVGPLQMRLLGTTKLQCREPLITPRRLGPFPHCVTQQLMYFLCSQYSKASSKTSCTHHSLNAAQQLPR